MRISFLLLLLTVSLSSCRQARIEEYADADLLPIIPWPESVSRVSGTFTFNAATIVAVDGAFLKSAGPAILAWISDIRRATNLPLPVVRLDSVARSRDVLIIRPAPGNRGLTESYDLTVSRDKIIIVSSSGAGLFYALQTLRQLMPAAIEQTGNVPGSVEWTLPAVVIHDQPRFRYRGMHLDVSRHFFPVEFIKRYIDLMARYKMNFFHWHLTDDQGWRIEIKKYPRLVSVGSTRRETIVEKNFDPFVGDGTPYKGYYTQDDIRGIVSYAKARYVTIVPEIELPGHATAALAAYPDLACTSGPFEVATTWGVKEDILCPTESTLLFFKDVLTEVVDLFPGPYIHIGGDEVPKTRWKENVEAQKIITREGLSGESELQGWFIKKIAVFLSTKNRRIIGWDEIIEGGTPPDAIVMSWRGITGGVEAARAGHDVIMTPTQYCYFDYYQGPPSTEPLAIGGYTPLDTVYAFEPVPSTLEPVQRRHILGAQGNVWTEYISTSDYVEYMAYPRAIALSEVVWTSVGQRNFNFFLQRLALNLRHLQALGVNYRIPNNLPSSEAAFLRKPESYPISSSAASHAPFLPIGTVGFPVY